jgi:hypothetical protein
LFFSIGNTDTDVTGKYNQKLLFFSKSGEKQGEITIDCPATAVAVINDEILAVAAYRAVVLVDTKRFKHIDLIPLGDIQVINILPQWSLVTHFAPCLPSI